MTLAQLIGPEIAEMLKSGDFSGFRVLSQDFHAADVAEIVERLPQEQQVLAFLAVDRARQPEVFDYLNPDSQTHLLENFKPDVLSHVLSELPADSRTELLQELPAQVTRRLLEVLPAEERKRTLALLDYPENSTGRLMTPEFLHVPADATAADVVAKVRKVGRDVETVYVIYVIDSGQRLIGTVSLRDVVIAQPEDKVSGFMTENVASAHTNDDRELALNKLREYDLVALPVVDQHDRLVGIVTFDDLSDVAEEEATEDILKMHGVATELDDYFSAGVLKKFRSRATVLVSLVLVSTFSVLIQQEYNTLFTQLPLLAAYITMLAASSGNVGTQSAGILIRAISMPEFDRKRVLRIFSMEVVVGVLLATAMALIAVAVVSIRGADAQALHGHSVGEVALILGLAMLLGLLAANTLGAALPLIMRRLKIDPAVTAGPFITTAADILTVLIYFNTAHLVLLAL